MGRCFVSIFRLVKNSAFAAFVSQPGGNVLSDEEDAEFWTFYRKTSETLFRKAYRMCVATRPTRRMPIRGAT